MARAVALAGQARRLPYFGASARRDCTAEKAPLSLLRFDLLLQALEVLLEHAADVLVDEQSEVAAHRVPAELAPAGKGHARAAFGRNHRHGSAAVELPVLE